MPELRAGITNTSAQTIAQARDMQQSSVRTFGLIHTSPAPNYRGFSDLENSRGAETRAVPGARARMSMNQTWERRVKRTRWRKRAKPRMEMSSAAGGGRSEPPCPGRSNATIHGLYSPGCGLHTGTGTGHRRKTCEAVVKVSKLKKSTQVHKTRRQQRNVRVTS